MRTHYIVMPEIHAISCSIMSCFRPAYVCRVWNLLSCLVFVADRVLNFRELFQDRVWNGRVFKRRKNNAQFQARHVSVDVKFQTWFGSCLELCVFIFETCLKFRVAFIVLSLFFSYASESKRYWFCFVFWMIVSKTGEFSGVSCLQFLMVTLTVTSEIN